MTYGAKTQSPMFLIIGWMTRTLGLKNDELFIYALIYSFSCKKGRYYTGSLTYLANRTGFSRSTVVRILKSLVERGYITKQTWTLDGVRRTKYAYSAKKLQEYGISESADKQLYVDKIFIPVYDWMTKNMHLSGNELSIYALIYSFSDSSCGKFTGNISYIAKRLNITRKTAGKYVKVLIEKGYVEQLSDYSGKTHSFVLRALGPDAFEKSQGFDRSAWEKDNEPSIHVVSHQEPLMPASKPVTRTAERSNDTVVERASVSEPSTYAHDSAVDYMSECAPYSYESDRKLLSHIVSMLTPREMRIIAIAISIIAAKVRDMSPAEYKETFGFDIETGYRLAENAMASRPLYNNT